MAILKTNRDEVVTATLIFEGPIVVDDFRPVIEPVVPPLSKKPIACIQIRGMDGDLIGYVPIFIPSDWADDEDDENTVQKL